MRKKIFKYIKVMMASLLIASLTIPSYAAVSASDGSAFVTKAEFDAAMSDFNARLTTFEAGINSKIDSQVSSYLDRNGIWNGLVQTFAHSFNSNSYAYLWDYKNGKTIDNTGGFAQCMTTNAYAGAADNYCWHKTGYFLMGSYKLVNNVSKTGLAFAKLIVKNGENDSNTASPIYKAVVGAALNRIVGGYGLSQEELIAISYDANNPAMGDSAKCVSWASNFDATLWTTDPNVNQYYFTLPAGNLQILGFVKSGAPLYFVLGAASLDSDKGGIRPGADYPTQLALTSVDIKIY